MKDPEDRKVVWENALSVIKKLLIGSFVIIFVGICAYLCLLILMKFI